MSIAHFLRASMCVLPAAVLTACGGGGGSDPSATPSKVQNYVSVDAGNSTLPLGRYPLDTSYKGVSDLLVFDVDPLEAVAPESTALDMGLVYAPSHPEKFAIFFGANRAAIGEAFACRSNAWTAVEVQVLEDQIKSQVPLCSRDISIDATARHVSFTGLVLTAMNQPGKSVTISADFAWVPPVLTYLSNVTVESGSSLIPLGAYGVTGRSSGSYNYNGLELSYSALETSHPVVQLYRPKGDDGRFVLSAETQNGSSDTYACISAGWSALDKQKVESSLNSPLQTCPSTVSYDSTTRLLTLSKAVLPGLHNSGNQVVLSVKASMPEPVFSTTATSSPVVTTAPSPAPVTPPAPSSGA